MVWTYPTCFHQFRYSEKQLFTHSKNHSFDLNPGSNYFTIPWNNYIRTTHTQMYTHTRTRTHSNTVTQTLTQTDTHRQTQRLIHTLTKTDTHTHTRTIISFKVFSINDSSIERVIECITAAHLGILFRILSHFQTLRKLILHLILSHIIIFGF